MELKYYKFIDTFISLHKKSGLAAHFMRRWEPYQMPISDNECVETFKVLGIQYNPREKKWWQFWRKGREQMFISAISKINLSIDKTKIQS